MPKDKMIRKSIIVIVILFLSLQLISAAPILNFTQKPSSSQTGNSTVLGVDINESSLDSFTYHWNGTNYTIYDETLIVMYNFDNISELGENNNLVVDLTDGKYNGTPISGASYIPNGVYNGAYDFDKSSIQKVDVGDVDELDGTQYFTISTWVKYDALYDWDYVFTKRSDISTNVILMGTSSPSYEGIDDVWIRVSNGYNAYAQTYEDLLDTDWHQWVLVYNGTEPTNETRLKFYFDGIQRNLTYNDDVPTTAPANSNSLVISGLDGSNYNPIDGKVDEFRIWARPLSSKEIYQQYISSLNKYGAENWNFTSSHTDLEQGETYYYQAFATNASGDSSQTERQSLQIITSQKGEGAPFFPGLTKIIAITLSLSVIILVFRKSIP